MSVHSAYRYVETKDVIIKEMKQSSKRAIESLQKNTSSLMAAYAINEYENLILNEMEQYNYYAVVVEDFKMGTILGADVFISGKIRDEQGGLVEFDDESPEHKQSLATCCYSDKGDVIGPQGDVIGNISIYLSNEHLNKELNGIVVGTAFNSVVISVLLIMMLWFAIRYFIIKPVSEMVGVISNVDEDGVPVNLINAHGVREIDKLSNTMNNMISSIKKSRVKLTQQHEELLARKDQLRILSMATEQSPVSIIICDKDNVIEYVNPQFEKTSGYKFDEVMGQPFEYLFESNPANKEGIKAINSALDAGKTWIGELTPLTKDEKIYWIRLSVTAILNDEAEAVNYVFVAEDITDHKRNEEMLRNSQKMEAVGQLTGGVAHDFNNLLGIIMGNLELLEMSLQGQPKQLERIRQALTSTQRGAKLTRKLLNFARTEGMQTKLTQVNSVIENLVELIAKSITASIKLETRLEKDLWLTRVDTGDLEDAILNLCLNARDAMPDGGTILIATANQHLKAGFVPDRPDILPGDYVSITVSDNGVGINEDAIKRVFDPFYSTKPFGKGTGLGLSMVYGFVQRSDGYIHIESEPGKGSQFHVFLPRVDANETYQMPENLAEPVGGKEKILIVDDEIALSETAETFLQQLGYQTLVATNAERALELLSANDDIDLLFSDVVMPEVNGFELSINALKQRPGLKILLASGFTSEPVQPQKEHENLYRTLSRFMLKKPYNTKELGFAIRQCLDSDEKQLSA